MAAMHTVISEVLSLQTNEVILLR